MDSTLLLIIFLGTLAIISVPLVAFYVAKIAKYYYLSLSKSIAQSTKSLNEQILNSVQTRFIEITPSAQSIVDVATEVWRLEKRLKKVSGDLSDDQNKAFENSITKLRKFLDKNDMSFMEYTGHKYNEGLNVDVLSIEKSEDSTDSIIKDTHEPAIFHKGKLIKKARVVVLEK